MDLELKGKRVLITGASKGIGYACALSFAREGAQPIMVARNADTLATATAAILQETGVPAESIAMDMSQAHAPAALFERAGGVDFLVNNAGAIPGGDLFKIDEARWRAAWDLKLFGYINLTRVFLGMMQARKHGVIANIIGMAGVAHRHSYIAGTAANAGLIAFTNAIGAESTHHGVRVFGINPGSTRTERLIALGSAATSVNAAFGRPAEPREVADLVVFGCSPRASYLSGTVINLDGGAQYAAR